MTSLNMSKKGCPRASQDGLLAAEIETYEILTTAIHFASELPVSEHLRDLSHEHYSDHRFTTVDLLYRYMDQVQDVDCDEMIMGYGDAWSQVNGQWDHVLSKSQTRAEVRRTAIELFKGHRIVPHDLLRLVFPSTSANYYNSRAKGGAVQAVGDVIRSLGGVGRHKPYSVTMRAVWNESSQSFVEQSGGVCGVSAESQLENARMAAKLVRLALEEPNLVETVALPEALKVRVITKGPCLRGYVLKPLQMNLWRHLSKIPQFSLIGRPVDETLLTTVLGHLAEREKWLSGDYKAATDMLFAHLSEAAANAIIDTCFLDEDWADYGELRESFRCLFIESLTRHKLLDPRTRKGTRVYKDQQNGQLMGSIMSFPILCIVNAAICRKAVEMGQDEFNDPSIIGFRRSRVKIRDLPLLINGDDCVFPATPEVHKWWLALCPSFGMLPSVGKYYWSDEFLNINSTTFLYEFHISKEKETILHDFQVEVSRIQNFKLIKFINLGLLFHVKRSGGSMGPEDIFGEYSSFRSNSKDLLETLPDSCKAAWYDIFIKNFKVLARQWDLHLPFFVPVQYGGVGLLPFGRWQPSRQDRSICKLFKLKGKLFPPCKKESLWIVHKTIMHDVKQICEPQSPNDWENVPMCEESPGWDEFYGEAVVNLWLTSSSENTTEGSLWWGVNDGLGMKALRPYESAWRKAERLSQLPSCRGFDPWQEINKTTVPFFFESFDWRLVFREMKLVSFGSISDLHDETNLSDGVTLKSISSCEWIEMATE